MLLFQILFDWPKRILFFFNAAFASLVFVGLDGFVDDRFVLLINMLWLPGLVIQVIRRILSRTEEEFVDVGRWGGILIARFYI